MEDQKIETKREGAFAMFLGPFREPVTNLAKQEERSMGQMIRILLREALAQRGIVVRNGEKKAAE